MSAADSADLSEASVDSTPPARRGCIVLLVRAMAWGVVFLSMLVVANWLLGRLLSDRYAWSQWLLWLPTPAAIAFGILAFLIALVLGARWKRLLVLGMIAIMPTWWMACVEHRLLHEESAGEGMRIAAWNPTYNKYVKDDISLFARAVVTQDADITILTDGGAVAWHRDVLQWLGQGLSPTQVGPFTILTRMIVFKTNWVLASDEIYIVEVWFGASHWIGRELRVLLVDLPSDPKHGRMDIARRAREAIVKSGIATPDVVVGDFNMTRGSAATRFMFPNLRDLYDEAGSGWGATFPRDYPLYHIDQMLIGPDRTPTAYRIVDPGVSRHRIQIGQFK